MVSIKRVIAFVSFMLAIGCAYAWGGAVARGAEFEYVPAGGADAVREQGNEVVFGLRAREGAEAGGSAEFTVMSYNIQNRPFLDNAEEKLPLISPLLNGFDVVLIQECFTRHELLWERADYPNRAFFGALGAKWKATGSGLSMLTRLPLEGVVMTHYNDVGELQNKYASKGILMMRLVINGMPVDVYDTHMEAGDKPEARVAHQGQVKQMIEFVKRNSPPEHGVIIAGDFNMGPRVEGKTWQEHGNYSNEEDMKARTDTFKVMVDGLGALDVFDVLNGRGDTGIERFLYRAGAGQKIEPLGAYTDNEHYRRKDGSALSDGSPRVVRFRITSVDKTEK